MRDKVIVTCAVTGGGDTVGKHPAIPVTPGEIANAALEARAAGDGAGPIHGRDVEIQAQLAQHIRRDLRQRLDADDVLRGHQQQFFAGVSGRCDGALGGAEPEGERLSGRDDGEHGGREGV
jgi:hypothetical protein